MLKNILNIGFSLANDGNLNRKIRISNLISFITIITMIGYIPVAIGFNVIAIIILNSLFLVSACFSFYLNSKKKYDLSFYLASAYGLLFFVIGTVFYGIAANLHFFILIMCLIAIALFKSNLVLRIYISTAIISFFLLVLFIPEGQSIISFTTEMKNVQKVISFLNLLLLFIITILFFVFFRRENLLFQKEIIEQKDIIEEKQKEIVDSFNYAKKIQFALLASDRLLQDNLPEHFVLFMPKDIVSGDFYWGTPTPEGFIFITADCTGHGVPGAFMSLLNISKLRQVINENKNYRPGQILNNIRTETIKVLNSGGNFEDNKDGMDAVLCKLNLEKLQLEYAAANNSFYIVRDKQLLVFKADKMPVGKGHDDTIPFSNQQIDLKKGDLIYTFTDGYADQFGGPKGKKFKYKQLEEKLLSIHHLPLNEQQHQLKQSFLDWKSNYEQVDDVLIIGIKI